MALTETERALLVAGIAASVTITEALLAALAAYLAASGNADVSCIAKLCAQRWVGRRCSTVCADGQKDKSRT